MRLCVLLRSANSIALGNNTLTIRNISFLPAIASTSTRMHGDFLRLLFLQAHRETEAHFTGTGMPSQTQQARGILTVAEKQGLTRGGQSGGITDQSQCRGLWHSGSPSARSLSRSPSSPPPSFTQSPFPPRSLVRDGQTNPHRPRLVFSRSTCPPLSLSPHTNSFILGTAVINTRTNCFMLLTPRSLSPRPLVPVCELAHRDASR